MQKSRLASKCAHTPHYLNTPHVFWVSDRNQQWYELVVEWNPLFQKKKHISLYFKTNSRTLPEIFKFLLQDMNLVTKEIVFCRCADSESKIPLTNLITISDPAAFYVCWWFWLSLYFSEEPLLLIPRQFNTFVLLRSGHLFEQFLTTFNFGTGVRYISYRCIFAVFIFYDRFSSDILRSLYRKRDYLPWYNSTRTPRTEYLITYSNNKKF